MSGSSSELRNSISSVESLNSLADILSVNKEYIGFGLFRQFCLVVIN